MRMSERAGGGREALERGWCEGVRRRWTKSDIEILIFKTSDNECKSQHRHLFSRYFCSFCYPHTHTQVKHTPTWEKKELYLCNWIHFCFDLLALFQVVVCFYFLIVFLSGRKNCWPLTKRTYDWCCRFFPSSSSSY